MMTDIQHIEIDEEKCSHCMKCMLVCSAQHEGLFNPRLARLKVEEDYIKGRLPNTYCRQCPSPAPCEEVCPTEAISRNPKTGALVIDEEECSACEACVDACPYNPGVIWIHPFKRVAMKCDLCDGDPQCVKYCPREAVILKKVILEEVA